MTVILFRFDDDLRYQNDKATTSPTRSARGSSEGPQQRNPDGTRQFGMEKFEMLEPNTTALSQGCDTPLKRVIRAGRISVRAPIAALAVAASLGLGAVASNAAAQTEPANVQQGAAASFQKQAADLGIKSCANLFATLGDSLTRGTTYASNASTQKDAHNDHAAQAVVGMRYDTPNYKGQSAGVVFTSPTRTGCEGGLVRVAPFPQSCPDVVKQLPPGSSLTTTLTGTPLYNLGGNQGQALLVPSGSSCVVVTVASAMDRR